MRFAVVPAVARNKQPDPVFVFAGGPGQAATKVARQVMPVLAELNARRDIVFIDQRGTGRSNALECDVDEGSLASALEPEQQLARLGPCLKALPADLRQYATWIAVRDFEAIRAQLGAEKVNLWGASYGTRAALEYMRQYPDRVRTAVLDGVAPPDMALPVSFALDAEAALKSLADVCARDERCRTRYPDFDQRDCGAAEARRKRDRHSHSASVTGATESLRLDRKMLASLLRAPLYVPQLSSVLPYALAEAGRGDFTALVALSAAISGGVSENFAVGMHFAVICAEDVPRIDAASASPIGGDALRLRVCRAVSAGVPSRAIARGAAGVLFGAGVEGTGADFFGWARSRNAAAPWRFSRATAWQRQAHRRAEPRARHQRSGLRTDADLALRARCIVRSRRRRLSGTNSGAEFLCSNRPGRGAENETVIEVHD